MSDVTVWPRVRLGDVIEAKYGKALPQAKRKEGAVPVYGSNGIIGHHDMAITRSPTIVVGRKGSSGAVNFSTVPCWPIDTTYYIDESGPYVIEFLDRLLRSLGLTELDRSTAIPGLNREQLYDIEVPVPPVIEQQSIVEVLSQVERLGVSASSHLSAGRRVINRFRQAVLAAACSGRLTADWREENEHDVTLLTEGLCACSSGFQKPVAQPKQDLIDGIPPSWDVVTLGLLIERIEAGKSFNALGRPAMENEWGVIKVSAMSWGRFRESENKAVPEGRQINPSHEIKAGDLLISRANTEDLVGATVLVDDTRPHLLLSDKSLRLVPKLGIDKAWLNYALRAPLVRSQFSERATGTSDSMRNLSQEKILATTITLPATAEQQELARRVGKLLQLADRMERRIEVSSKRVERSSQAVLAKAFRGELVASRVGDDRHG